MWWTEGSDNGPPNYSWQPPKDRLASKNNGLCKNNKKNGHKNKWLNWDKSKGPLTTSLRRSTRKTSNGATWQTDRQMRTARLGVYGFMSSETVPTVSKGCWSLIGGPEYIPTSNVSAHPLHHQKTHSGPKNLQWCQSGKPPPRWTSIKKERFIQLWQISSSYSIILVVKLSSWLLSSRVVIITPLLSMLRYLI